MDGFQFIAEITKYLSWPVAVGIGIYMIKDKINLDRLSQIKHRDTEIVFGNTDQTVSSSPGESQSLDHLIPSDITGGVREQLESTIYSQLPSGADDSDKIAVLIKNLAQEQISKAYEKIYYTIFGSQIRILEFLAVQDNGATSVSNIFPFYEQVVKEYPATYQDRSFTDYMNFLVAFGLVINTDNNWMITRDGRAFLTYITAAQLDKNKML